MKLHAKTKGNVGQLAVATHLSKLGYPVFAELGDSCKVDLIILDVGRPYTIQVKYCTAVNGKVDVYSKKSGPGYSYNYTADDVDIFAIYEPRSEFIFFVATKEVAARKSSCTFRLEKPANGQKAKVRYAADYVDIKRILRDYTRDVLPGNAGDDDIVQTATT